MPERYHNADSVMGTEYIGPFADLLGMEFLEQGEGTNVSRLPVSEKLLSRNRVLHGGAVFSIADTSMGLAYGTISPEGRIGVTNEIKICYFAPVPQMHGRFIRSPKCCTADGAAARWSANSKPPPASSWARPSAASH